MGKNASENSVTKYGRRVKLAILLLSLDVLAQYLGMQLSLVLMSLRVKSKERERNLMMEVPQTIDLLVVKSSSLSKEESYHV